ncbi:Ni/Fe hydrogenase subunit alpha [Planctomycetales bacterium ZRK34]|nr:Ni/Fe hydrogenase subunit alpha [Planctomycetales bacterium ZRK34]
MAQQIKIEPVTRIEGHAKITLTLGDDGKVNDAMFHVTQFRGFEKFVEGRPLTEMPSITARICGICPVSHLMASAKACDDLLSVEIPPTAVKLRRLMNLAQFTQSHALSFFHLSSPDLLLGFDADPATRNVVGLVRKHPQRAADGIKLRKFGQRAIELLGGKRVHPAWLVPGGVNKALDPAAREEILAGIPQALDIARRTVEFFKTIVDQFHHEIDCFGNFPTMFAGLVAPHDLWEHYDGTFRFIDSDGIDVVELNEPREYQRYIGEAVEEFSYLKSPYYKPMGYPDGIYRVGPLARVNICKGFGTPLADEELAEFRQRAGNPALSSFHFHWARLLETLHAVEQIQRILEAPDILDKQVRARARPNRLEGVGISEAPRGSLIHHYKIDEDGRMVWANLIIATGHNNLSINRGVLQVAKEYVDGTKLKEGMLNRVEAVVRTYDPCLSCSTHALGQMAMKIELTDREGQVLDVLKR